jgi:hypothetical protein
VADEAELSPRKALDYWRQTGDHAALVSLWEDDATKRRAVELAALRFSGADIMGEEDAHGDLAFIESLVAKAEGAPKAKAKALDLPKPAHVGDPDKLPPRPVVFGGDYVRGFVSATTSPGGRGKSSLLIAEAIAMAAGLDIIGKPAKTLRVLHYCLEDGLDELEKRLGAALRFKGLSDDDLGDNLFLRSGRDHPLTIASPTNSGPRINKAAIDELVAILTALRIDVLQLDPLISLHNCPENSNETNDIIVKELGRVAARCNCAIMIANHARKLDAKANGVIVSEDSRGGGAFIDGVRVQRLLNPMSEKTAQTYGVAVDQAWRYLRLDDGKNNLRAKRGGLWFKLESQQLANATDDYEADNVQVCVYWPAPDVPGRGTDAQEKIAMWMLGTKADESKSLAEMMTATGLPRKNFKAAIMGGQDRVRTSCGVLVYGTKIGRDGASLALIERDGGSATDYSADVETPDDEDE